MIPEPFEKWTTPERTIGMNVRLFDELPSTNDIAAELGEEGLAIIARRQTAGRGQHGRVWQASADSSLLCSIVVPPVPEFQRPAIITAWIAVGIAQAIEELTNAFVVLKWPNDLLVEGRKICGILIETGRGTIAGFGLNLNQTLSDFGTSGLPQATSLHTLTGSTFGIRETFERIADHLDTGYRQLRRGELEPLETAWIERTGLLGRDVRIERYDGSTISGRLCEMGFQELVIDIGTHAISLVPETIRHIHSD